MALVVPIGLRSPPSSCADLKVESGMCSSWSEFFFTRNRTSIGWRLRVVHLLWYPDYAGTQVIQQ